MNIKVNIPLNEQDFMLGVGEGIWIEIDDATKEKWEDDENSGIVCSGRLRNDSIYYPNLTYDTEVPFILRGKKRPMVIYHGFLSNFDGITIEQKHDIMRKVTENSGVQCRYDFFK